MEILTAWPQGLWWKQNKPTRKYPYGFYCLTIRLNKKWKYQKVLMVASTPREWRRSHGVWLL